MAKRFLLSIVFLSFLFAPILSLFADGQKNRVGVLATLPTTLEPTCLVQSKATQIHSEVEVMRGLCEGAFEALIAGKVEGHE